MSIFAYLYISTYTVYFLYDCLNYHHFIFIKNRNFILSCLRALNQVHYVLIEHIEPISFTYVTLFNKWLIMFLLSFL